MDAKIKQKPATAQDLSLANLCRNSTEVLTNLVSKGETGVVFFMVVILVGSGMYGVTIGLWRSPLQGVYTAIKFPCVMVITALINSGVNGMMAQLQGMTLSWRQSLGLILSSYAILSAVLASMAPILLFFLWNLPSVEEGEAVTSHGLLQVAHVGVIAFAGVLSNVHLYRCLAKLSSGFIAARVLICWLLGNVFLGCQVSWLLRPFMGSPNLTVEFLRADAFEGNFYESVWNTLLRLTT